MTKLALRCFLLLLPLQKVSAQNNWPQISGNAAITAIAGAFPPEMVLLRQEMVSKSDTVIQKIRFTRGLLGTKPVVLAQTGIGKVNAAIVTTLLLEHFRPARLIFSGIAGGTNPSLVPGDIVIGEKLAYHDYGAITPDSLQIRPTRDPATMADNPVYFSCDEKLIVAAKKVANSLQLQLIKGPDSSYQPHIVNGIIVTGDVFVGSELASKKLWQNMHAQATEMEGAAVAQTCWQQKVPFLVIRSLSDNANNRAATDVRTFYEVAAHNSASLVIALVKDLKD